MGGTCIAASTICRANLCLGEFMRAIVTSIVLAMFAMFWVSACGQRDEGNKDQEIIQARQAYDRCSQLKGQTYCNSGKMGNVASVSDFYGQSYYYNFYGYNTYLSGTPALNQLTADQVNTYFENYLRKASKQEIITMSNRWLQMSTEIGVVTPATIGTSRCTVYGCF
jgi:hypothetical protein